MRVVQPDWGYIELECSTSCDLLSWRIITFALLKRNGGTLASGVPFDLLGEKGKLAVVRCSADHLDRVTAALHGEHDGRTVRVLRVSSFLPALF